MGAWKNSADAEGGGVIRTPSGGWYVGYSSKYNAITPLAAELYAIREGLEMDKEFKIKFLEVETVAEILLRMLPSALSNHHDEVAAAIMDVAHLLNLKSWTVYVVHIPRERNRMTHKLAQFSMTMNLDHKMHFSVSDCA
ncbi:uncharacterized protein LOC110737696 [Chenopodium quinoa]|uniref:uncharacterized protein LOC110737696 n=1 Tax=Chenopodium quinoa TaxID=63459 RepID=UPI000B785611|nr:uncharacterized protein LOC110737696 [Chenopodium quinoa]